MGAGPYRQLSRKSFFCRALLVLVLIPQPAAAQETVGQFLGGAAVAFAAHEGGHLLLDGLLGADVDLRKVSAGPIPFFAIGHQPVSPVREFAISSAGFWVQHATDELMLTKRPHLRDEHAPFVKGMLAFNVLASMGYAVAAFAQKGPLERDTRGMALSSRVDEPWIGGIILAPAVLDAARYYEPDAAWLKWASRAAKTGGVLLIVRAAR